MNLPKWLVEGLGGLLVAFVALLIADKAYSLTQTLQNKNPKNTISVSAEGKVSAIPDLATVNLGVLTQGDTAERVQSENSQKINKIIDFVKQKGIERDDISTSQFNIYPNQDYRDGKATITGYQANQTITIKVRGVDKSTEKLGEVLAGVTSNGANQINGVSLGFDDPDDKRQEARKLAIEKAKAKAEELAKASGLRLGKVVNVSESGGFSGPPIAYGEGSGGAMPLYDKAVSPNIEPGNQDITATMMVVFEVK